jgi:hypothetical protein
MEEPMNQQFKMCERSTRVNVEQDGCSIVQKGKQLNPHKLRMRDLQLIDFANTKIKSQSPKKVESFPYVILGMITIMEGSHIHMTNLKVLKR